MRKARKVSQISSYSQQEASSEHLEVTTCACSISSFPPTHSPLPTNSLACRVTLPFLCITPSKAHESFSVSCFRLHLSARLVSRSF